MSKVLILDDDLDILNVMTIVLGECHEVRPVSLGKDWLKEVTAFKPDIIILDIRLGILDGVQICKELKFNSETKHIKVILTSAAIIDPNRLTQHADGFLEKPFSINTLEELVENI